LGEAAVAPAMNLRAFICNAAFLQTVASPTFGSNGALWSLSNEFWYYMLFPALVSLACSRRLRSAALPALALAALAFLLPPDMLLQFPIWLGGAALAGLLLRWRVPAAARAGLTVASAAALAGSLLLSRGRPFVAFDFVVAGSFTAFLCAALSWNRASAGYQRAARTASGFSYTLYAFHSPILRCIRALLSPSSAWQPTSGRLAIAVLIAGAVIAFCFAISRVTEHRTKFVRNWVRTLMPNGAQCSLVPGRLGSAR
jgi:peptidoglycan/LPS O-acetylase OafA/YrhL